MQRRARPRAGPALPGWQDRHHHRRARRLVRGYHADLLAVVWVGDDTGWGPVDADAPVGGAPVGGAPVGGAPVGGAPVAAPGRRCPARTGADTALPLWLDFMRAAQAGAPRPAPLPRPPLLREVALPEGGREWVLPAPPAAPALSLQGPQVRRAWGPTGERSPAPPPDPSPDTP